MSRPYAIGIDLGTTNCAVAWAGLAESVTAGVTDFPVPQLQGLGEVTSRPLLPSFLYLPAESEFAPGTTRLPWGAGTGPVVGEWARAQGARVPGRLVASAKSWLCHPGVDRTAAILPWGAPPDAVRKLSPVEATTHLLAHLVAAWDQAHPEAPLADQEVVVTVPASFDEVARALTAEAARRAGLPQFTLLEEPQAAFYDFLARHRADLAGALDGIRLILVVDVGGGTTDFSLLQVEATSSGPRLRRLAVGDHLLLGGDNMDAALAHWVEEGWRRTGRKLGALQWSLLVQAARAAKEALLGETPPESYRVAVAGEGSRLLGDTLSATIPRAEAERLVLDGFLPPCAAEDAPGRLARTALQELGLPYAKEPAITRHLAAFLREHAAAGQAALAAEPSLKVVGQASSLPVESGHGQASSLPVQTPLPRPDALLLNGGSSNPNGWSGAWSKWCRRGGRTPRRSAFFRMARSASRWRGARRITGACATIRPSGSAAVRLRPSTWGSAAGRKPRPIGPCACFPADTSRAIPWISANAPSSSRWADRCNCRGSPPPRTARIGRATWWRWTRPSTPSLRSTPSFAARAGNPPPSASTSGLC
ncbi:MAG: Hsp70 family protein [Verrucomicrobia bacterium]|nr:Hsp70 family protein [Verrucomicrobiota bacterium]